MSRVDDLEREQVAANARYRAAKSKAKLRSLEAKNARKASQVAGFYVSRLRWTISKGAYKEVLSIVGPGCRADIVV
jgi:hypothetical protein